MVSFYNLRHFFIYTLLLKGVTGECRVRRAIACVLSWFKYFILLSRYFEGRQKVTLPLIIWTGHNFCLVKY